MWRDSIKDIHPKFLIEKVKLYKAVTMDQSLSGTLKLNGENWSTWKFQSEVILKSKGLYSVITGEFQRTEANADEWCRKDAKAQEIIALRLKEKPLNHIITCQSAHAMWAKLKAVYEHQSAISVHLLQQKFFNMGYTNCTVAEFVSQLEEIQQQLKHLGEELSDAMLIPKVLMALPDQLKHFVSAWESTSTEKEP